MRPWLDDGDVALYHGSALTVLAALPAAYGAALAPSRRASSMTRAASSIGASTAAPPARPVVVAHSSGGQSARETHRLAAGAEYREGRGSSPRARRTGGWCGVIAARRTAQQSLLAEGPAA